VRASTYEKRSARASSTCSSVGWTRLQHRNFTDHLHQPDPFRSGYWTPL